MFVAIIGSLKDEETIRSCEEYWRNFGHEVFSLLDKDLQEKPLVQSQLRMIDKISFSDLVVAIPKKVDLRGNGSAEQKLTFGEGTTYEMAVASYFKKPIVIW